MPFDRMQTLPSQRKRERTSFLCEAQTIFLEAVFSYHIHSFILHGRFSPVLCYVLCKSVWTSAILRVGPGEIPARPLGTVWMGTSIEARPIL